MMKKILVVEDTPANIKAAKAYFSQQKDCEFTYATDRKTAETLLPTCDALITDREIPYQKGEKRGNYKLQHKGDYENARKAHGYMLLAEATSLGIPAIMVSTHGELLLMVLDDVEFAKEVSEQGKKLDPYTQESFELAFQVNFKKKVLRTYEGMDKTESRTWELAFAKIPEKNENREKSTEIDKIKLR